MRCFVALDVSDATRALAMRVRESVSEVDPEWRAAKWVARENLHVTLAFLGEVTNAEMRRLVASLYTNTVEPFTLRVPVLDAVPGTDSASIIWIRYVEGSAECSALAELVRSHASEGILLVEPVRPFVPHVTLVRSHRRQGVSEAALSAAGRVLDAATDPSVSVSSVRVFSSSLGRVGPTYTEVAEVPLLGARGIKARR